MWRDGDQLGRPDKRTGEMLWMPQPVTFVLEQQDQGTWWILVSVSNDLRPTPGMQRFVVAFREALRSFLTEPLALVHQSLPDDIALLQEIAMVMGQPGH